MNQQKQFDFSEIPIVDTHAHGPLMGKDTSAFLRSPDFWYNYFLDELTPKGSTDQKLRSKIKRDLIIQSETRPNWTSIRHYLVKSYGLKSPDSSHVEQFLRDSIKSKGLTAHTKEAFQRENISWVLVDHSMVTSEPISHMDEFPEGRKKWTHPITHLLQPKWAQERGLEATGDIADALSKELRESKRNGCSGFKSHQAYFRDLSLRDVSEDQATEAFNLVKRSKPRGFFSFPVQVPQFESGTEEAVALKTYQDFVLKKIFCEAGKLRLPMLIHVAAALTPSLKTWNNDPEALYSVLDDDDVKRANTTFVLLHTGFPEHHKITTLISQYPNLYVDLSWISCNSLYLLDILREYLSIASSTKITHGSDSANPDIIAYAAHNTRVALSQIATWLYESYGWNEREVTELAENVLHANADRIFSPN